MKPRHFFPLGLLAFALAGCASAPGPHCARLAYDGWFCLLAPSALAPRAGTALVTVTRHGDSRHYVGRLSITSARLDLALMNLAGAPAATLHWDGAEAGITAPPRASLDAQRLVALLELTLAAPARLRPALHGLTLSTARTEAGEERRIRTGSDLVAQAVIAADGVTHIEVPRIHLEITLRLLKPDAGG